MDLSERNISMGKKRDLHRYLVVLASCLIGFLNWGMLQSFGTYLPFILETFSDKRSQASVIHSVLIAVAHIVGVASGTIIKKWGTGRLVLVGSALVPVGFILSYWATTIIMLYIYIGLVAGVGMSFTYVSAVIVIGRLFSAKGQTAVLSIQNVGTGIGGSVLPYLIDWSIKQYNLSGSLLLIGGLLLNNVACAIIIRFSSQQEGTEEQEESDRNDEMKPAQMSPISCVFVLFLFAETFAMSNTIGIHIMLLDILKYKGLTSTEGLHCLVAGNAIGTPARFLPLLTKIIFKEPMVTLIIASVFGLIGVLILNYVSSFAGLLVGTMLIYTCDGATISSAAVVIFQILVPDSQAFCYGLILTIIGAIVAGLGPLYGGIFDLTDSYSLVFLIAGTVYCVCIVAIAVCITLYHRFKPKVQDTRL